MLHNHLHNSSLNVKNSPVETSLGKVRESSYSVTYLLILTYTLHTTHPFSFNDLHNHLHNLIYAGVTQHVTHSFNEMLHNHLHNSSKINENQESELHTFSSSYTPQKHQKVTQPLTQLNNFFHKK